MHCSLTAASPPQWTPIQPHTVDRDDRAQYGAVGGHSAAPADPPQQQQSPAAAEVALPRSLSTSTPPRFSPPLMFSPCYHGGGGDAPAPPVLQCSLYDIATGVMDI
eukprot:gene3344-biopygen423